MSRTPLIVGNWKLHHGPKECEAFLTELVAKPLPKKVDIGLCPTAFALPSALLTRARLQQNLLLFAQNVAHEAQGAFTGENSATHLQQEGVDGSLIGHSERRHVFGETDELIQRKVQLCLKSHFKVILCIGETLEQRESQATQRVCQNQLKVALNGASKDFFQDLAIAYEPVWAIGTGKTASPEQAEEAHQWIRRHIWDQFGQSAAESIRILYGGSVKPENARAILQKPNIDGLLIGGASLKVSDFAAIVGVNY